MTRAFDHIAATAHLQLVEEMPDHYPQLQHEWARLGGTTMPTSPLTDVYTLTWEYIPYTFAEGRMFVRNPAYTNEPQRPAETGHGAHLRYKAEIKWAKHVPTLVKLIDKHQISHRSRAIALAVDALRINEMDKRINQVTEYKDEYLNHSCTDRESYEISQIVREETRRHLHLNYDWIHTYIKEHIRSSLGGYGHKWREALAMPRSEWESVLEIIKENLDAADLHSDWYAANFPRTGERARSLQFSEHDANYIGPGNLVMNYPTHGGWAIIDRTRVIIFGNHMSLYTVFIPDKASWYSRVLEKVLDVIKPTGEYRFPFMEGGHIYRLFSDWHQKPVPFHAYDGKSWDAGAGMILGKYMHWLMVPIAGIPQVASGQSHTSMNDTIASIVASRDLPGMKMVLGDDIAHFGRSTISTQILEADPEDTKYKFNLGLTFYNDPLVPRISGLKATKDRGRDMRSLQTSEFVEMTAVYGGTHSAEQRALHAGMYLGQFGKGTLLERIEKLPPNDWRSPGELLDDMVETTVSDVFEWADKRGIKEVFI